MSRQNTFSELIKETNKVNVPYLSFSTLVAAGPRWCRHSYIVLLHQYYINITYSMSISIISLISSKWLCCVKEPPFSLISVILSESLTFICPDWQKFWCHLRVRITFRTGGGEITFYQNNIFWKLSRVIHTKSDSKSISGILNGQ